MIKVIIIVVLALCLAGSLAWGYINFTEVGELKQAEMQLQRIIQDQSQQLQKAAQIIDALEVRIDYVEEVLRYAGEENDRLERQVRSLSELVEQRGTAYDTLYEKLEAEETAYGDNLEKWKTAYSNLLANYNTLIEQTKDPNYLEYLLKLLLF